MAILVIGNGFDIGHGLPTEYADFLEFLRLYVAKEEGLEQAGRKSAEMVRFVKRLRSSNNNLNREVHHLLSHRNNLLAHFQNVCEERQLKGLKRWVDFEYEISSVIQLFERAREEETTGERFLSDELAKQIYQFISAGREEVYPTRDVIIVPVFFEEQAKYRLDELNVITRLLEIYLSEFVNKLMYVNPLPQIASIPNITHVLSFNYTNTYQRLYGKEKTQYCYIHGKAEENSSLEMCNMVLGIDEYLKGEAQSTDNAFIWFKKFYQRIYKETSSEYIDWLDYHIDNCSRLRNGDPHVLDIYFYGHSLDVTDKDVLEKLILHDNARIHIFYRNKVSMAKQITNLVKVIGEEKLIRMTRGSNRSILFEPIICGGGEG